MDPEQRAVVGAVGRRPGLWATAVGAGLRHLPRRGRGRADLERWLRFRLETAYGDPGRTPDAGDVVTWLRWARAWPRVRG